MSIFTIFKESTNSFEGQETGEEVLMLIRRHPFFIVMKFIFSLFAVLVPIALVLSFSPTLLVFNLLGLAIFFITIWTIVMWLVFFYHLTMYTLDVWIITDRRIIDSTQHGFFNRTVSELHRNRVQDVTVTVDGFIQSTLGFGDIQVQTAGTEEKFKFIQVPDPEKIKNEIMKFKGRDHQQL